MLGGISSGLQRPLKESKERELLAVGLGEEPVWPIHCPRNTVESEVAPVKEKSWSRIGTREAVPTHGTEEAVDALGGKRGLQP